MTAFDAISDPLPRRLADGLARLAAVARQLDQLAADKEGLSPTQAEILAFLVRRPEGVRLSAAAAWLGVRSPTASDAVAALVRKGLVRKGVDAGDGRAVLLQATAEGRALTLRWPASFEPMVAALTAAEQELLLKLLVRMIRHLQQQALIVPQRMCVSCRFFRENVAPGRPEPHFCAFVGAAMADRHLRLDCPEHELAAA